MDLVCKDTQLNISPAYLKPGFAFGGSCLPKDLRATLHLAQDARRRAADARRRSWRRNRGHIDHAIDKMLATGKRRIGMIGLSFKTGTDDLRESPLVLLAEQLIGKGLTLLDLRSRGAPVAPARRQPALHRAAPAAHRLDDPRRHRGGDRGVRPAGRRHRPARCPRRAGAARVGPTRSSSTSSTFPIGRSSRAATRGCAGDGNRLAAPDTSPRPPLLAVVERVVAVRERRARGDAGRRHRARRRASHLHRRAAAAARRRHGEPDAPARRAPARRGPRGRDRPHATRPIRRHGSRKRAA